MGNFDEPTLTTGVPIPVTAKRGDRRPYFVVYSGVDEGQVFELKKGHTVLGRDDEADIRLNDNALSRKHVVVTVEDELVSVSDLGSTNGTFVNGERIEHRSLTDGDRIQIGAHELKVMWKDSIDAAFARRQYSSSKVDTLTGAYNKRHLMELLRAEFSFSERHKKDLVVLMIDLDHFKKLNDTYGHMAGDRVLADIGDILRQQLRGHDMLARFGGEEFVVVMRETTEENGRLVAERLRRVVEANEFSYDGKPMRATFSIGVACYPSTKAEDGDELMKYADEALYRAKAGGRNCVSN